MRQKHKVQILGLGLALALSQAAGALAASGTVTVGQAPGSNAAQTESSTEANNSTDTAASGSSAATTSYPTVLPAVGGTTAADLEAVILHSGPGVSKTQQSSGTVTAGTPAAGTVSQTPAAGTDTSTQSPAANAAVQTPGASGPGTVSSGTSSSGTVTAGGTSQPSISAADIKQPEVAAEGAVLLNAATGEVLYGKNQDQQFYPASITKVMTALVVLEHCDLNETVTFSETATTNLESGAVALGVSAGDQLTVEQSLYGLLLKSANEIGNGLAEHVSGSVSAFADLMNAKAKELGCKNTHFANPHGLNNENHKTTPYDMALILRAAVANDTFRRIDTTTSYEFPAIKNSAARIITMGHKMMYKTDSRYYEGIIGGKTGYTSKAGNTLVTAVERDGVRLIAVVMKASGTHYTDTKAMLDYGFALHAAGKI